MNRRTALAGVGTCVTGLFAGCLGDQLAFGDSAVPRLVGMVVGNWHPDPQSLNVLIEGNDEALYEQQVQLPGGDPSEYDRPPETLEGHPSELPPSATLLTWVDGTSREEANTLNFGERSTDCIGVEIEICPVCEGQKGQEDISVPEVPETLILSTSSCDYPGFRDES